MTPSYLRAFASRLLARVRARDPAPTAQTWDAQYAAGRWAYLGELPELARFSVLAGYLRHFKPGGAILDVGCGEGVLAKRLGAGDYRRYLGVDLSRAAHRDGGPIGHPQTPPGLRPTAKATRRQESFDAIVFNEVLYFFTDPSGTVERYARQP